MKPAGPVASVAADGSVAATETDPQNGLSAREAVARLETFGPNEIVEEKRHPALEFLKRFRGPIPWMIEAAAVLSAVVRHWNDFVIILVLLIVNAVVGFWEESQAGNAIAALKATLAVKARVKRDGAWTAIPARDLVPGDWIRLRMGDVIPADAMLEPGDPVDCRERLARKQEVPRGMHPRRGRCDEQGQEGESQDQNLGSRRGCRRTPCGWIVTA